MNVTMFYGSSRKKAKLAFPVDGSDDELGFSDEENEQLAIQQGESEGDGDRDNDDFEPENEDGGDRMDSGDSKDREDSEGESAVTGITSKRECKMHLLQPALGQTKMETHKFKNIY